MKTVNLGDVSLQVADRGTGPPVLLVHGFPLDHTMWSAQIDALAARYRVIAPDLRGFGRSGVTPGVVTMQQHADDLARLLDELDAGGRLVFCGLSMGGYIGWQFWRKHGDRLAGLILCDTRAAADTPEAAAVRLKMADMVVADGVSEVVRTMLPRLLAPDGFANSPEVVERIRRMITGTAPEGIAAAQRGMAARPDATPWLAEIDLPALLVVGAQDELTPPAEMQSVAAAIQGARLVVVDGAGHMSPMEKPGAVNEAILGFLEKLRH